MENILIEKAENGFIVYEDFNGYEREMVAMRKKVLVFANKKTLNKYINSKFNFETDAVTPN